MIFASILLFAIALGFNIFVGNYVDSLSYGPPLQDIILDHLPLINVEILETVGFQLIMVAFFLYPLIYYREKMSYVLKQTALLIFIRNITILLTNLPSPAQTLNHSTELFAFLTYEHDLLFSGHVAFPFLAFLMYKTRKAKNFFLSASIVMSITVLLLHSHYSVDVWAAFFFTYTSYKLGEFLFKKIDPSHQQRQ